MHSPIITRLTWLACSRRLPDEHGVNEFTLSGPLQMVSALAFWGTMACLQVVFVVLPAGSIIVRSAYVGSLALALIMLAVVLVTAGLVKERAPWEWFRWVRRHIVYHSILAVYSFVVLQML
jgi:hypothetical protein